MAFVALLASAAGPAAERSDFRFSHVNTRDGLSENTVTAIVQDTDGFLWFGTQDGLNRFDGIHLKVFSATTDQSGPSEDFINDLHVARDGTLWIATFSGGINRYEARTGLFTAVTHADSGTPLHRDITALAEDSSGRIWAGTAGGGLHQINPDGTATILSTRTVDWLPSDKVSALAVAADGQMLIGTSDRGAVSVNRAGSMASALPLPFDDVSAILIASDGSTWVGSATRGLAEITTSGQVVHHTHRRSAADSLANDAIADLFEDRQGQIWVATAFGLDMLTAPGRFTHNRRQVGNRFSLPFNEILAVFEDRTGTLWVGTGGGGVSRRTRSGDGFLVQQHIANDPTSLSHNVVWSVTTSDDALWVGTFDGGIDQLGYDGTVTRYNVSGGSHGNAISNNDVRALLADRDGVIWAGTKSGLNLIDPSTGSVEILTNATTPALPHNYVRSLHMGPDGDVWAGTYGGGLVRLRNRAISQHYQHDPDHNRGLSDDRIYSLAGLDDELWIGTHGGGLNLLNLHSETIRQFRLDATNPESLSNDRVLSLLIDRNKTVWVGTADGLNRFDREAGSFKRFGPEQGLPNEVIYGLAEDADGFLWCSTNLGIVRFDPGSEKFSHYPLNDILVNTAFSGGAYHQQVNRIYFGGVEGLVSFEPDRLAPQAVDPIPVITELRIFNERVLPGAGQALDRPIEYANRLVFDHTEAMFSLHFSALDVPDARRLRFQYRLLDFDDRWIETGAESAAATYTALPPGDYQFQLRTSYGAQEWSPSPVVVDITAAPAPWLSAGAKLAYALLLLTAVALLTRARIRRAEERKLSQLRIAASEERLRLALWGSGNYLWDWDFPNGQLHSYSGFRMERSHAFVDVHAPRDLAEFFHPDDFPGVEREMNRCINGEKQWYEVVYRAKTEDGEWSWVLARGRVVGRDEDGHAIRVSGMTKNINELKSRELELEHMNTHLDAIVGERTEMLRVRSDDLAQRNEQLNRTIDELTRTRLQLVEVEKMASLGRMVAGIAHEINTPLGVAITAISASGQRLSTLDENCSVSDTLGSIRNMVSLAEKNLGRAAEIVRLFKQVAAARETERVTLFSRRDCVEEVLGSLDELAGNHRLVNEIPAEISLRTRRQALELVVHHALENALKHAYANDQNGMVWLRGSQQDGRTSVQIVDSGVGGPKELERQIFEPFFTTTRGIGAMGLGMHIAYNVVSQALRGEISCKTGHDEGLIITVVLPDLTDS